VTVPEGDIDLWGQKIREVVASWFLPDLRIDQLPSNLILPLENPDLFNAEIFASLLTERAVYQNLTLGLFEGTPTGFTKSKFGSPAIAMLLDLLKGSPVKRLIGVGYCGALQSEIKCGDLVVPWAAIRDENTSTRYVDLRYPACVDTDLFRRGQELCQLHDVPLHSGLVWSTDSPLLETTAQVNYWAQRGVIGVDMETSTVLTLARAFGIAAAIILVASDNAAHCALTEVEACEQGTLRAVRLAYQLATGKAT
jgi:uridine phosphorylase